MNNDQKIEELKKQIAVKKEQLKTRPKVAYATNGLLKLEDKAYNINVLNYDECFNIVSKLCLANQAIKLANEVLDANKQCEISNYLFEDWIADIKLRMMVLAWDVEKNKLSKMDAKLTELLSEEAKTKGSIDDIAKELGL